VDFVPKDFGDAMTRSQVVDRLLQRILALGELRSQCHPGAVRSGVERAGRVASPVNPSQAEAKGRYRLLVIGASTGGPMAIQSLLSGLPADFSAPILVAVHMPANFTPAYAERLDRQCRLSVSQARDGDRLRVGHVLLAPGGRHMILDGNGLGLRVRLRDGDEELRYQPSVDLLLGSAGRAMPGAVLGVVLTGMGNDGVKGARSMKQGGGSVWVQDEASCVVYGMPAAIAKAGLADRVVPLDEMAKQLMRVF